MVTPERAERQVHVDLHRHMALLRDGTPQLLEVEVRATLTGAPELG